MPMAIGLIGTDDLRWIAACEKAVHYMPQWGWGPDPITGFPSQSDRGSLRERGGGEMSDFFWFSDTQLARIEPLLLTDVRGKPRG